MSDVRSYRIFVASASKLLTDHKPFGEGLISWDVLSGLAARGHDVVACARHVDLSSDPPFRVEAIGRVSRFETLEPLAYARRASRILSDLGGSSRFDLVHWLFPQGRLVFRPPPGLAYVVGPWFTRWSKGNDRQERTVQGALLAAFASPLFRRRRRRALAAASTVLFCTPEAASVAPEVGSKA